MSNLDLLTTAQVAELAGRSVKTVARWVHLGALTPRVRAPGPRGAMLFHPDDVEALLRSPDRPDSAA